MSEIREYTQEERRADMLRLLNEKGLKGAVKACLDEVSEDVCCCDYVTASLVHEHLCNVLDLIELAESEGAE